MTSMNISISGYLKTVDSSTPMQTQTKTQTQHLHESQPNSTSNSTPTPNLDAQILRAALSRKQKQLIAARQGHVNIAIEPLEKQIRMLEDLSKGLEQDGNEDVSQVVYQNKDVNAGTDWVVLSARPGNMDKEDDEAKGSGKSGEKVMRQGDDVQMHAGGRDLDHENNLGTWI